MLIDSQAFPVVLNFCVSQILLLLFPSLSSPFLSSPSLCSSPFSFRSLFSPSSSPLSSVLSPLCLVSPFLHFPSLYSPLLFSPFISSKFSHILSSSSLSSHSLSSPPYFYPPLSQLSFPLIQSTPLYSPISPSPILLLSSPFALLPFLIPFPLIPYFPLCSPFLPTPLIPSPFFSSLPFHSSTLYPPLA